MTDIALVLYYSLGVSVGLISPPFAWQSPPLSVVVRALASSEASLAHSLRSVYSDTQMSRLPRANNLMRMRMARAPQNYPGRPKQIFSRLNVRADRQTEISSLYRLGGARSGSPQLRIIIYIQNRQTETKIIHAVFFIVITFSTARYALREGSPHYAMHITSIV